MKKNTQKITFATEAFANLQLFISYLLHYRKKDDFISRQNIKAIL